MKSADINKALRALRYNENALRGADLRGANLCGADLRGANLRGADLCGVNLHGALLTGANLTEANLTGAKLTKACLGNADLRYANLCNADLYNADLCGVDLTGADMSEAIGISSPISFMENYFKRVPEGYIAYKTFGAHFRPNPHWKIEVGSILTETVNPNRQDSCGCGINVAPLKWVAKDNDARPIYKLLIRNEWLMGVVVPFNSDGHIRCEKAEIIGVVE